MVASQMFLFQVKRKQDKETKQQKEQETQRPPPTKRLSHEGGLALAARLRWLFFFVFWLFRF